MDAGQLIITLLASGGGGGVIVALINGIFKWASGAASRERQSNTSLLSQRRDAVEERDREADLRHAAENYATRLRQQLIVANIVPEPWPETDEPVKKKSKE